eukprot:TRINITY_DN3677_c0_g1_i1.p1 TRINITY_DN3677_c0_g1~~TRINITY_DN3677_c0_g1_i1.p1  ORF type:complete len:374 (+),score=119.54 TRINITY_DN3677_c0_g1_i1:71-1123(+)
MGQDDAATGEGTIVRTCRKHADVMGLVVGYSSCSALLVVINKWALTVYPYGATLTAIQFGSAAVVVRALGYAGVVDVDPLEWSKVIAFLPAVILFYISVASNLKLLEHANVDTFIVVRSCTPLATLGVDMAVSNIPTPSVKSIASLVLIIIAACGYVVTDEGFKWDAYFWALLYLVAMTVDQVVIKKVVTNVKLSRWGLVFYNNLIAACMMPVGCLVTGEATRLRIQLAQGALGVMLTPKVILPVVMSCAFGIGISYFGLNTRRALTATAFTVLGVVCKFGTVLINTIVWSRHASAFGVFCVCVCILGGILYQQAEQEKVLTPAPAADPPAPSGHSASLRSSSQISSGGK